MERTRNEVLVVGGGPAGFFAAIACAQASPGTQVTILERGDRFLDKVRISGGGRCNVTHAGSDPREFAARYPRGGSALVGPLHAFSAADTRAWFTDRGVPLKVESDGRVFPVSDSSQTIVDCLIDAARTAGVALRLRAAVTAVVKTADDRFDARLADGQSMTCQRVLLATGGCRAAAAGQLAVALGHRLEPPVPSLFTLQVDSTWLRELAGVSVADAEVSVPAAKLRQRGPLLVTHWGLSGPAVLRLSAWGARALHALDYKVELQVNWLPDRTAESLAADLNARRHAQGGKRVVNVPLAPLPARLWERLVCAAGLAPELRWASLTGAHTHALVQQLTRSPLAVMGKSLNKEEFVTCGGVRLAEVDFKTMESRVCPGLYFAGELLDIDGVTGGFNFQAAWTTGFIAGNAMARWPGAHERSAAHRDPAGRGP